MKAQTRQTQLSINCKLVGVGAWGPGFSSWQDLQALFLQAPGALDVFIAPKPEIIPANERRRAPLPVKMAVEVSWQATQASGLPVKDIACVFGSGLGDTQLTDYMCTVLAGESKQLSPTKFHNSVHNAAAGYWTISTDCMRSANSVAAYHHTVGLSLLEAMIQCHTHNEAVLITLFDTAAHNAYQSIFPCNHHFASSVVLVPIGWDTPAIATLNGYVQEDTRAADLSLANEALGELLGSGFEALYRENPSAKMLPLLKLMRALQLSDNNDASASLNMSLSESTVLSLRLEKTA